MKIPLALLTCLSVLGCAPRARWLSFSERAHADGFLIQNVRVFDGKAVHETQDVWVQGKQVVWVGETGRSPAPSSIKRIPGGGKTLLPGFWDAHLHIGGGNGDEAWAASLPNAQRQLEALLYSGVTTVVDAGHDTDSLTVQQRLLNGSWLGPRMFRSTRLYTAVEGHPLPFMSALIPWPLNRWLFDMTREVDTPERAQAQLERDIAQEAPDFVKVVFNAMPEGSAHLPPMVLRALIEKAHSLGRRANVHVGSAEEAVTAAEMGADMLMHVPWENRLTEEQAEKLARWNVPLTTTARIYELAVTLPKTPFVLSPLEKANLASHPGVFRPMPASFTLKGFPETFFTKEMTTYHENLLANLRLLHSKKALLVLGTDSGLPGVIHGGAVHREMQTLVALGLTPLEVLSMVTSIPASRVGQTQQSGIVAAGAEADLLLVEGNPTEDITATQRIVAIWKGGKEVERGL